jgi:hypothetical protein
MKNKFLRCLVWYPIHSILMVYYFMRGMINWDYDESTDHCIKCKIHYKLDKDKKYSTKIHFDLCPYCYNKLTIEQKLKLAKTHVNNINNYLEKTFFNEEFIIKLEDEILTSDGFDPLKYRKNENMKLFNKHQELRNKKLERLFKEDE